MRDRILAGLTAFAAGDALGVPWEGRPPEEIEREEMEALPAREGWPRGATSDDTACTLLVARTLAPGPFLAALSEDFERIRGTGPSTRRAVKAYRATGRLQAEGGTTNGAAMRALPTGWAIADARERQALAAAIARTTHAGEGAVRAAGLMAALAAAALEDRPLAEALAEAPLEEVAWPAKGVPLDAVATASAVLYVLRHEMPLRESLLAAVALGGDTDTVAALVGGIVGCRAAHVELPWLEHVELPDGLDAAADALASRRSAGRDPAQDRLRSRRR
jgi:ADP-ribosyl-[dinitrogen reductase] hydrolase